MRVLLLVLLSLLVSSCAQDEKKDFADSISGPGVTIHCFNASPNRPVVGDTNTRVNCPTGVQP